MEVKNDKWPVMFKRVATAVAFSPTALAVMHEAVRVAKRFEAQIFLIHAGKKTPESEQRLNELLTKFPLTADEFEVIWREEDPATAILLACKENQVDLLIAGALQHENLVQYFRGSVARKLSRKANCSLLLLTHPTVAIRPCKRIIVNGLLHPKTNDTIKTSFYIADAFNASEVTVVEEIDPKDVGISPDDDLKTIQANRKKNNIARSEHKRIEKLINELPKKVDVKVTERCIFGKKGYSIGHYTEKHRADLLVMNSPDTKLGFLDRIFTHDLEYILSDLPTDLLLVHTTRRTAQ